MRSSLVAAATTATALGILGVAAAPAHTSGDPEDDVVRELSITIDIDDEGTLHVQETYEWDFGEREGLGFFRTLSTEVPTDEGRREFQYQDFALNSPTGAPSEIVETTDDGEELELTLGAPEDSSDTRTGLQTYELSYTVDDAVDPDSLEWITAGPHSDVHMDRVTTEVTAPEEITGAACWQGEDSDLDDGDSCDVDTEGATLTATSEQIEPGGWQAVELGLPQDTFPTAEAVYAEPTTAERLGDRVEPTTDRIWSGIITFWWAAAAAVLALAGALLTFRRRQGQDEYFLHLPQGSLATSATPQDVGRLTEEPPAIPRHATPEGVRPYEAAILWHKSPHYLPADFTVLTVLDLAVRGYLTLEETTQDSGDSNQDQSEDATTDWLIHRNKDSSRGATDVLHDWEHELLSALFASEEPVKLSELGQDFRQTAHKAQKKAIKQFNHRHLLKRKLSAAGSIGWWVGTAVAMILPVATVVSGVMGMPTSFTLLVGFAAVIAAIALVICAFTDKLSHRRTAHGRAHYEQLRGLQLAQSSIVEAPETDSLAAHEITEQLPYAMALGDAERWAELMDATFTGRDQHAQMHSLPTGSWASLTASMPGTLGASHQDSSGSPGGFSSGGFSAGSFGGGGGVAGR